MTRTHQQQYIVPDIDASWQSLTAEQRLQNIRETREPTAEEGSNNVQEDVVLEYVDHFKHQYYQVYPTRPPLLLSPKNEYGIYKFICTYIIPTELPYPELYDCQELTRFLAEYVTYEPLAGPFQLPHTVVSPYTTLKCQKGSSFDICLLMTSFLIGVGYDAYCVSGSAERHVTLNDESVRDCPIRIDDTTLHWKDIEKNTRYRRYNGQCELREKDQNQPPHIHCWIAILAGQRDVEQTFFVEPSTGEIVDLDNDMYLTIESMWNHENYWCNMQDEDSMQNMSFDLMNLKYWERVLIQDSNTDDDVEEDADDAIESGELDDEILNLPKTWVRRLGIDKQQFENRFPGRAMTVRYRDTLCEYWAQYQHEELMTKRFTVFDKESNEPLQVHCFFERRKDKLLRRSSVFIKSKSHDGDGEDENVIASSRWKVHEWFSAGRNYDGQFEALKETIVDPGHVREFKFYSDARLDGLESRTELYLDEDFGKCQKIIETFQGRSDRLCYRSVRYRTESLRSQLHEETTLSSTRSGKYTTVSRSPVVPPVLIAKMTEKYQRNHERDANGDVMRREFNISEKTIRLEFHYEERKIVNASREYVNGIRSHDLFGKKLTDIESLEEFKRLSQAEKECEKAIRDSTKEINIVLERRNQEEEDVLSMTTIYDTIRNRPTEEELRERAERERLLREQREQRDVIRNYLPPSDVPMTVEIAERVYHAVLEDLKERLLVRGRIIQDRLQSERAALAHKKTMHNKTISQSREASEEADEEYMLQCEEHMFRINILEQRKKDHIAKSKSQYDELRLRLMNDKRLHPYLLNMIRALEQRQKLQEKK